jgi:hypothetical protein
MQQSVGQRPVTGPAVLGLLLMGVGAAVLLARAAGFNLFETVGAGGWPLFILIPGVILLVASLIPARPNGVGLAIAGAIVTTVGLVLLYQWQTGHWASWAYTWTLLPGAAGVAQVLYGLFAGARDIVTRGLWMTAIAGLLFAIGAWYFEGLFAGEPRAQGIDWWPIGLIVIGGIVVTGGFLRPAAPTNPGPPTTQSTPPPSQPAP